VEYCQELLVNQETVIAEQETVIAEALEKMDAMAATIAKYQRMLFGQKRERFEYPNNQLKNAYVSRLNGLWSII
jgi:plasmid maintenance system killer protein